MTRRAFDRYGMSVQVGRTRHRPFGRIPDWPERQQVLDQLQTIEAATNVARTAYRQRERSQPCAGCGAAPRFPHNLGCATPWG